MNPVSHPSQRSVHRPQRYLGWHFAEQQLPQLGLSLESLREFVPPGKVAADIGSCWSPYPVEARLFGISVVPIDLRYGGPHDKWETFVRERMLQRYPAEACPVIEEAIVEVNATRLCRSASDLSGVADGAFSLVTAHQVVPKHSASVRVFLEQELPELLRVTERSLRLYPFGLYQEDARQTLFEAHALSRDASLLEEVRAIAARAGFTFVMNPLECARFDRVERWSSGLRFPQ